MLLSKGLQLSLISMVRHCYCNYLDFLPLKSSRVYKLSWMLCQLEHGHEDNNEKDVGIDVAVIV
jgi:hypothetical protein